MKSLDGRCSVLVLREKWKNIEFMPTVLVMTLFAAAMRERFVCHFHISTICQQSHTSTNFKILGMSIFQPFAINFACQPILAFSTICRIWRSPAICNNFSDAFVGGRLARADEWENVFFLGGVISRTDIFTMSMLQPFVNNVACQPISTFSTI